jgi:predicted enzyme related to lactoylglutathione lyase
VFGVWEPRQREGAQLVNASNAWAMSTLMTNDVDRAVAFYGVLFGWKPETFDAGAVPVTTCRLRGYVGGKESQPVPRDVVACIMSSGEHSPAAWNVDFWIDDVDAAAARAGLLGGRVVVSPYDTAIFRQAVLADREGATFSVSQPLASGVKRQKGGPHASRAASGAA